MKIGFTGTRVGMSPLQKMYLERILIKTKPEKVIHGGCIGADTEFHGICYYQKCRRISSLTIAIYPSNLRNQQGNYPNADFYHKEQDPLVRNHIIVDQSDILIAAPKYDAEELRSGTWSTIRYARKIGIPVVILPRGEQ